MSGGLFKSLDQGLGLVWEPGSRDFAPSAGASMLRYQVGEKYNMETNYETFDRFVSVGIIFQIHYFF